MKNLLTSNKPSIDVLVQYVDRDFKGQQVMFLSNQVDSIRNAYHELKRELAEQGGFITRSELRYNGKLYYVGIIGH